jgi:hypothetical protein
MNTRTRAPKVLLVTFCLLIQSTLALAQVPNYIPSNGLVGWWPFNGNANDESGNGHHGVGYMSQFGVDRLGNNNKSLLLTGNDDHVNIGQMPVVGNLTSVTFSAWINPLDLGGKPEHLRRTLFSKWKSSNNLDSCSFNIHLVGDSVRFTLADSNKTNWQINEFPSTLNVNSWAHVIFTFGKDSVSYYENGNLVGRIYVPVKKINSTGFFLS